MSNATSGKDDDIVSLDDSASKKTPNQQKKPVLKLASFAGMIFNIIFCFPLYQSQEGLYLKKTHFYNARLI